MYVSEILLDRLWLASFIEFNVFRFSSVFQWVSVLLSEIIAHCMHILYIFMNLSVNACIPLFTLASTCLLSFQNQKKRLRKADSPSLSQTGHNFLTVLIHNAVMVAYKGECKLAWRGLLHSQKFYSTWEFPGSFFCVLFFLSLKFVVILLRIPLSLIKT